MSVTSLKHNWRFHHFVVRNVKTSDLRLLFGKLCVPVSPKIDSVRDEKRGVRTERAFR